MSIDQKLNRLMLFHKNLNCTIFTINTNSYLSQINKFKIGFNYFPSFYHDSLQLIICRND